MNDVATGWGGTAAILLVALLLHEPWRWFGLYVGRDIDTGGGLFVWTRAVATALIAGLVLRLVIFPAGALAEVGAALRLAAVAAGTFVFWAAGRNMPAGVVAGAAVLQAGQLLIR